MYPKGLQSSTFTGWPKLLLLGILLFDTSSFASWSSGQAKSQNFDVINHRAMIKASLLQILGLKSLPQPVGRRETPPYMQNLFKQRLLGKSSGGKDTIRSFRPYDHQDCGCPPNSCTCMFFNISRIPETEQVSAAKLGILVEGSATPQEPAASLEVEIYQIIHHGVEIKHRLIDTQIISTLKTSWMTFNVKPAVKRWKRGARFNHGLKIRIVSSSPFSSTTEHVRLKKAEDQTEDQWLQERPILVTFTNDRRGSRRSSIRGTREGSRGKRHGDRQRTADNSQCRRHRMYIDFRQIGWGDWIAAPYGYNAYYCGGECGYPLASHHNPTNYSILQTLVNSINPRAVSKVCCVPTKMSPIMMLVRDGPNHVVIKTLQNMVVEECGCR